MSKITEALEKAARERLQRSHEQATATAGPVVVPLAARRGIGEVTPAGQVAIDPHIICAADSESPIAEQYRILRTNLQSLRLRSGPKVIVVTSAVNGEGKSVTSTNLATDVLSVMQEDRMSYLDPAAGGVTIELCGRMVYERVRERTREIFPQVVPPPAWAERVGWTG